MLVGNLILGARVRINDLPRTLSAPAVTLAATVTANPGANFPLGAYYVKMTFLNQWGETTATNEIGPLIITTVNESIIITAPTVANFIPGSISAKVYIGTSPNGENAWIAIPSTANFPFIIEGPLLPGVPPTRNTSFYPDVDGQRVSVYTLYQWLNDALDIATNISNGIPDMTCLNTINNQTMYEIIGTWNKFDHGWWNGYLITLGGRDQLFYRNLVPGVTALGVLQQVSNRVIIELQPQVDQSGGSSTAAAIIGISDQVIQLASPASYILPLGMCVIGVPPDPSTCEVIAYSQIAGNNLTGIMRGMGGTTQRAWPIGTPVNEGNLRLSGLRSFISPNYAPGDAAKTISIPSGWSMPISDFMVARYRESEGNAQEANRLMTAFKATIKESLAGNALVAGPRQVGQSGSGQIDTWPSAGGFGIIVP